MMDRLALSLLISLAACDDHRTVTLLLGPDDSTLTAGFGCKDDAGNLLLAQARTGSTYSFQLVVETVDLGLDQPGCRGEELLAACNKRPCKRVGRFCTTVSLSAGSSPQAILASLHDQLGHPTVLDDAPADPVVVRAVATTQPCAELVPPAGDYPRLDPELAIGCAYSCPVVLGDLHGTLSMALDTLDDHCSAEVRACAKLAGN